MIIPTGYGHISHFFGGDASPRGAAVTYGVQAGGGSTVSEVAQFCHEAMAASFLPLLGPSTSLDETRCKFGPNDTGAFATYANVVLGGNTGAQVSPNVALLVEKQTGLGGRRGRGRMYIPGIIEAAVTEGGDLTGDAPTDFQNAADELLTLLLGSLIEMVVLHSVVSVVPTAVTALTVDQRVATQRRRLRG